MGVFGAVFGRRGDAGFNVALLSRLVREKVRPACPDGGREREKVRPARSKHPKIGVFSLAGRTFSRQSALRPGLVGDVAREAGCGGGFAALEAGWRRVAGVSGS